MDAVITFVNGTDPQWQQQYCRSCKIPILAKRFRDWGFLKYLLRGIDRHMPYIEKVHLVVCLESQVPDWVDRTRVNVVLHSDIIPNKHLPIFNSASIECYLHRIEGLSEQYVYFNDDMFPMMDTVAEDMFADGKTNIGFRRHLFATNLYKRHVKRSCTLARKVAGLKASPLFLRPQHICSPMLRSACEELFEKAGDEIDRSISTLREDKNYNQYLFLDYMMFTGRASGRSIGRKHLSMRTAHPAVIASFIKKPNRPFACINDVEMSEAQCLQFKTILTAAFEHHFPEKSRFEV
ncbi:MAG: hypothetical protein HUJ91_00585 [Bacteroidales bacterium]|nr:hypothetical protein [Bacteroidales bacterium]